MRLKSSGRLRGRTEVAQFSLHHGGTLATARLAYTVLGNLESPLVIALGGISAGRDVNVWWRDFVGEGKAIDTREFAVLGVDYLGGSGASTGPKDEPFPAVSTYDQARALKAALDDLGVYRVHAFIGSSYGGMVALAFGELFPERVSQLLVISAAHEPHPMATALRSLQRRAIRLGLETGHANEGVSIARGIAMTTYRTAAEFADRFEPRGNVADQRARFAVEDYLEHCGETYARDFNPYGFLCLSESIDLHGINVDEVCVPVTLVSVDSDTLVPSWQLADLAQRLPECHLLKLSSRFGHDAFLKEVDAVSAIIRDVLCNGDVR